MRTVRTNSRLLLTVLATIVLATVIAIPASVASGDILHDKLRQDHAQKQQLKSRIAHVNHRRQAATIVVSAYDKRLRKLDGPIDGLDAQISDLQVRIAHRTARIASLKADYVEQQLAIDRLDGQSKVARLRLAQRAVLVYERGGDDNAAWLVGAEDVSDLLDRVEAAHQVVGLDQHVVASVGDLERNLRVSRAQNHDRQREMRDDIAGISRDEASLDAARTKLTTQRNKVAAVRSARAGYLHQLDSTRHQLSEDLDDVEADDKAVREVISSGSASFSGATGVVSSAGLIWPVNGPIASPFGRRWGRMHEGIDIAVVEGTPIHAAASGIVTYASWMSGYGNFVIIQHSKTLATAYGHQSQVASHVGEFVQQGQVIGFSGCTGHCLGPHVHFETRIDGQAVDPMRFL